MARPGDVLRRLLGGAGAALALCLTAAPAAAGAAWDWQLTAPFDLSVDAAVIDLDPDGVSAAQVAALNARGVKTICYVSVGTVESYRDDAGDFPAAVAGKVYGDWADERFLDIRRQDLLMPLMRARFARCKAMGFAAIEPDNMDLHINDTGFGITAAHQVAYARALISLAHGIGLQIGQKNSPDLIPALGVAFDFVIFEGCWHDGFCEAAAPYLAAGRMVLDAEYGDEPVDRAAACAHARARGIGMIFKERELTAGGSAC